MERCSSQPPTSSASLLFPLLRPHPPIFFLPLHRQAQLLLFKTHTCFLRIQRPLIFVDFKNFPTLNIRFLFLRNLNLTELIFFFTVYKQIKGFYSVEKTKSNPSTRCRPTNAANGKSGSTDEATEDTIIATAPHTRATWRSSRGFEGGDKFIEVTATYIYPPCFFILAILRPPVWCFYCFLISWFDFTFGILPPFQVTKSLLYLLIWKFLSCFLCFTFKDRDRSLSRSIFLKESCGWLTSGESHKKFISFWFLSHSCIRF